MNVLIACERSGVVRRAFREWGHEAWSCDLHPADDGGEHIQCNNGLQLPEIIHGWGGLLWDLIIGHPPCTRLSNSGVLRLYRDGKKANGIDPSKWQEMEDAATFFKLILNAPAEKVCVENPIQHCHAKKLIGCDHTQTIQPFQFGHPESKRTCLWLKGLPPLQPTKILPLPECGYWQNQTPSGQNKLGPSPTRAYDRAKTYPGIAQAMAIQWTEYQ